MNNTTTNTTSSSQDSGISSQPCSAPLVDEDAGGSSQDSVVAHPSLLATDETLDSGIGSTTSSNNSHLLSMSNQGNTDCRSLSRTDSGICMSPTQSTSSSVNNLSTSEITSSGEYNSSRIIDKGNTPIGTANEFFKDQREARVVNDDQVTIGNLLATVETDLVKDQSKSEIVVNDHQDTTTAPGMNKNESAVTSTTDAGTQSTESDLNGSNVSSCKNSSITNIRESSETDSSKHSILTTSSVKDLCNDDADSKVLQHPKEYLHENSSESLQKAITTKKRDNVDDDVELPPSKMRRC